MIRNAADADIWGFEVEMIWLPSDYLTIQASAGYVEPRFKKFTGLELDGKPGLGPEDEALAKQLKFERIPDYEYTLAGSYRWPVAGLNGDVIVRAQYTYRDDFFTEIINNPQRAIEGHSIFDASITYEVNNWRVSLWGRNLNEETYAEIISQAFNLQRFGGQARTYGLDLSYRF